MDTKWLEDFLSLAVSTSFSRSADQRHVTQSALSRRIKRLESWLGMPLFDRTTYPIQLTPAGEEFLPIAQKTLHTLERTRTTLLHHQQERSDTLTFAMLNTLSLTFFPNWLHALEERVGPLSTRYCTQKSSLEGNIESLANEECDLLLVYAHPMVPIRLKEPHYVYHCLGEERVIPVSSADSEGRPTHQIVDDGRPIRYLNYGAESFFGRFLATLFARRPLNLAPVYENTMSAGLKAMVSTGCGVAWIPESLISDELKSGHFVRAADPSWDLTVEIRLYRNRENRRPVVEQCWEVAQELYTIRANPTFSSQNNDS